jgi:glycosyltransferase involved in cell wall biosynthesis
MDQSTAAIRQATPADEGATERPRILIVASTLHIGGAEQVAACLASGLDRTRFDVTACYLKAPGTIAEQMLRANVDLVPIPGLIAGKRDYLTFRKLRRLIKARRIQVIHTHDIHGLIDGALCRLTTPGLKHVHTWHFGNYPHRSRRHKMIEGTLWRVPDALIAVGHHQASTIRDLYRIPESRMRVVWNGVEDPLLSQRAAQPLEGIRDAGDDVPVIASISTLIRQKGLEHLLDAAALLRNSGERFRLLIAGHGVLREPLEARARELDLGESVRFLGWVAQAADRILPRCDIFVQSSLWEAMSVVVLEAMAAGKPMVVTRVGENPHVVVDEGTGLTVPAGDAAALAAQLRRLLREPALRARLGAAARRRYHDAFTLRHMIDAHEALYSGLCGGERTIAASNG